MDNFIQKSWFSSTIEIINSKEKKGRNITVVLLFIILVATIITYASSLNNDFVNYDDKNLITTNQDVQSLRWQNVAKFFINQYYGHFHPLTMLSYAIDYQIGGLNPRIYHTTSFILHLLNVILVFLLFLKLTNRTDVTTIISFLFALHPIQTESVSWLGARSNLLVTFFFMASLLVYVMYVQSNYRIRYLIIALFLFIFALLSKSLAVTIPLVLLLFDFYVSRKFSIRLVLEKIPFLLLSLLGGFLAMASAKAIGSMYPSMTYFSLEKLLMVTFSIFFYISIFFLPLNQSAVHYEPRNLEGHLPIVYYVAPFVLVAITVFVFISKKFRKDLIFGLLFYIITIALVIRIIPIGSTIVCERYAYIPELGIAFIVAKFFERMSDIETASRRITGPILLFIMLAVFIGFSILTFNRSKVWANGIVLFSDVIDKDPDRGFGYYARANVKVDENKFDEALRDYDKSIEVEPSYIAYYSRGNVKLKWKKYKDALDDYNKGIELKPTYMDLYNARGSVLSYLGEHDKAIADFNYIISKKPFRSDIYNNRGLLYSMTGQFDKAIEDYTKAIKLDSSFIDAFVNRGNSWMAINDTVNACTDWMAAAALQNRSAAAKLKRYCTPDGKPKKRADISAEPIHIRPIEDNTIPDNKNIRVVETTGNEVIIEDKTDGDQNRLIIVEEKVNGKKIRRLKRYNRKQILIEDGIIDSEGKYYGEIRWYFNNGKLKIVGFYKDVTPYGNWIEYYLSGNKMAEYSYENGLMHGTYKYYYDSGQLWTERKYNKGKLWEVVSNFKKNGEYNSPGTLKEGNGTVMVYDIEGKVLEVQVYKDGIRIQ
ncbi:MAG: tetratricopeptide repeat protein [Bacteroidia bacterium]|nr:tetratricopeptide repeat protein [Bacteroidia bacterium]